MAFFTVIGFWPDTEQRFATHIKAMNATEAENKCVKVHAGVAICGVLRGRLECVDTSSQLVSTALRDQ